MSSTSGKPAVNKAHGNADGKTLTGQNNKSNDKSKAPDKNRYSNYGLDTEISIIETLKLTQGLTPGSSRYTSIEATIGAKE